MCFPPTLTRDKEQVYFGASYITLVLRKRKVLLKLTFRKTQALNDMLYVSSN